jgi:hypothetical protein
MDTALRLIFFWAVAGLIFLIVYRLIYSQIRVYRRRVETPFSYRSRNHLFTRAETAFLFALEKAVGDDYRIFGKVRLADIVDTEVYRGVGDKAFSLIAYKHVDFLLCEKGDSSIVCAIELDDKSHLSEKRQIKDAEKEYALRSASVPLVRFSVASSYALNDVQARVMSRIGRSPVLTKSASLFCPRCGAGLVTRQARSGSHKGEFFVGCGSYPECEFKSK